MVRVATLTLARAARVTGGQASVWVYDGTLDVVFFPATLPFN